MEKIEAKDCKVPTETILEDIRVTQQEIDQFELELQPLRNDPVRNKLAIYMREGHIGSRKDFIKKLERILKTRT